MVIALVAVGAILGFVFTGGMVSQAQALEIRKPLTLGLQWLGLIGIALSSIAGGAVTLLAIVGFAAVCHIVWRSKAAIVVGAFLGSLAGALTGSSMGLLGANYEAFSNRTALILGVIAVALGVVLAPHRQVIAPITALTGRVRGAVTSMQQSGVKVSLTGVKARVAAVQAAARQKAVVNAVNTQQSRPAKVLKVKVPKIKTPKTKAQRDTAPTGEADPADETLSPDSIILGRIRAINGSDEVVSSESASTPVETTPAKTTPAEKPVVEAPANKLSDEEIIAELEKLLES